jgi:hypothetical protein
MFGFHLPASRTEMVHHESVMPGLATMKEALLPGGEKVGIHTYAVRCFVKCGQQPLDMTSLHLQLAGAFLKRVALPLSLAEMGMAFDDRTGVSTCMSQQPLPTLRTSQSAPRPCTAPLVRALETPHPPDWRDARDSIP